MANILLVEDDPILARGLQVNLEVEGYSVVWVQDLKSARSANTKNKLDLVILDLGLPDGSGFEFLSSLRDEGSRIPVIILTAQTHEDSVVEGLQRGANDYMRKPFGNRELLARIKSVLRLPQNREEQIRYADLVLLLQQRLLMHGGQSIELNRREFDILRYFMERAENIVVREAILQMFDKDGELFDRTVDSHISHLRSKLKKANVNSVKISSVYGIGYRLEKA